MGSRRPLQDLPSPARWCEPLSHSSCGSSRLSPTPCFLEQEQEVERRGHETLGGNHICSPHQRGLQSRDPNPRPSKTPNKDLGRHNRPGTPSQIRGSSPPPLGAASPSVVSGSEAPTCLHPCKYGLRGRSASAVLRALRGVIPLPAPGSPLGRPSSLPPTCPCHPRGSPEGGTSPLWFTKHS